MIEAQKGQYYFEVQDNGDVVYGQKFIGMEARSLVPGIVAGRVELSWKRIALILGVLGGIAFPGITFLDRQGGILSVITGVTLALVTSIVYDHFSPIGHLFQRRVDKQLLLG